MEGRIRYYYNEKYRYLTIKEKFRNKVAVVVSRRGAVWKHMAGPVFQVACFMRWERIEFFHNILSGSAQKDQGLLNENRFVAIIDWVDVQKCNCLYILM